VISGRTGCRTRQVRQALTEFMDAVIIVDPLEYQRYPDERPTPLRTLCFGPHDEGLVTFLVWAPDDLVLVTRIQWLGEYGPSALRLDHDWRSVTRRGHRHRAALPLGWPQKRHPAF
jgi:hypothetical protein